MTTKEYLLTKLMEEAGELTQIASKCNRFGLLETYEHASNPKNLTNVQRLFEEFLDLMAAWQMLFDAGVLIDEEYSEEEIQLRIEKTKRYMEYSRTIGTLRDLDGHESVTMGNPDEYKKKIEDPAESTPDIDDDHDFSR